jgi:hypothetical protein
MSRRWVVCAVIAAAAVNGCQGSSGRYCAECTPPKSYTCGYKPPYDNLVTKMTAYDCADSALKRIKNECGKQTRDFEAGFRQAYVDLAMARPALVPPVPPRPYWTAYYRSCAGEQAVADWFAGYRAGLDDGAHTGVAAFNRIGTSWSQGGVYAEDAALCAPPDLLPSPPVAPVPATVANPAVGPYGPMLTPTQYQTPAYAAPQAIAPTGRYREVF